MNEPSEVKCTKTNVSLIIWRVCNVCMSLFFALASYVQINDPDAVLWMVAYAIPANLCLLIAIKPHVTETLLWRRIAKLHVLISTAVVSMMGWTLYKKHITNIFQQEEGREFSGLMLILVWLLLCQHSGRQIYAGVGRAGHHSGCLFTTQDRSRLYLHRPLLVIKPKRQDQ
uniref:Transmembrane protein 220 n=1 Tax=Oncorhynchus mykiss TaxID=8022 RepID=A0A8C7PNI2_ONCMY